MLIQIFWVVFILFIWFNTDAFIQYGKLLKLDKLTKIDLWESYRLTNPKITYLEYISIKHRGFFTKLITCRVCLNFWITLIICLLFDSLIELPVIYMLSYITHKLIEKYV
jgi:hypothetical protein